MMRTECSDRGPIVRSGALVLLILLVLAGGCSSANPSNRQVAVEESPEPATQASWPFGGPPAPGPTPPPATVRPTVSGVTTDPGTRYLSMGSVGALTVETPPAPPPAKP